MKNYRYIARNLSGARQEGLKQAVSEKTFCHIFVKRVYTVKVKKYLKVLRKNTESPLVALNPPI